MKKRTFLLLSTSAAVAASGLTKAAWAQSKTIVVGGKDFTEQLILASLTYQLLAAKGLPVELKDGMGSSVVRQAMENGQIDVYWEYTGTSLLDYNKIKVPVPADQVYSLVKKLDMKKGIVWLNPSKVNNTFAFLMRKDRAQALGLKTMSDMANAVDKGKRIVFGCDPEFTERPDGLKHVEASYKFEFGLRNIKVMESGLVYNAVKQGDIDVGLGFATDGRIPAYNLAELDDDKQIFPAYVLAPCVLQKTLATYPQIGELLNSVSAKLDTPTMAGLNAQVDVNKKSVRDVAKDFLTQNAFI